jgi:hypothetical protein
LYRNHLEMVKFDYKDIALDLSGCGRRPLPSAVFVKLEATSLTRTSRVCPTSRPGTFLVHEIVTFFFFTQHDVSVVNLIMV